MPTQCDRTHSDLLEQEFQSSLQHEAATSKDGKDAYFGEFI